MTRDNSSVNHVRKYMHNTFYKYFVGADKDEYYKWINYDKLTREIEESLKYHRYEQLEELFGQLYVYIKLYKHF